jgi:hypothetical protein
LSWGVVVVAVPTRNNEDCVLFVLNSISPASYKNRQHTPRLWFNPLLSIWSKPPDAIACPFLQAVETSCVGRVGHTIRFPHSFEYESNTDSASKHASSAEQFVDLAVVQSTTD